MKFALITLYIALIGVFGFFYEDTQKPLKAMDNNQSITNFYDFDMPQYPDVKEYPITNTSYINNARTQSSYFYTKDSPIDIGQYYQDYWEGQGLRTFTELSPSGGVVSTYDFREGVMKTAMISQNGPNSFRVLLTATKSNNMEREFNSFSDVPTMKGSYGFISYESEEKYYKASNISYLNPHSLKENINFYLKAFPKNGWSYVTEHKLDKIDFSKTVVFEKGDKRAELNLTDVKTAGTAINLIIRDKKTGLILKGIK